MPIAWHDKHSNVKYIEKIICNQKSPNTQLLVLPEMFTTGFTMQPEEVAESMTGYTISWIKQLAKTYQMAITGSIVIKESNTYFNRMIFVYPNGNIDYYNKRHLFTLAGEDQVYKKGEEKVIINYNHWKICLQICYDLRFPCFSRNQEDYDLLIYVANWPNTRIEAWDTLLKARAIENMSYVIGVNRVGLDANNLSYPGHSKVFNHMGKLMLNAHKNEGMFESELDKLVLYKDRERLGFLKDKD